jgi:hypothetical protein
MRAEIRLITREQQLGNNKFKMRGRFKMKKIIVAFLMAGLFIGMLSTQADAKSKTVTNEISYGIKIKTTTYATKNSKVNFVKAKGYGKIDLGYGIAGYEDAGAGTQGITWNEGRWTIEVLSPLDKEVDGSGRGLATAKKIVDYLEKHRLPVPHKYGFIQVYTDGRSDYVSWQNNKKVNKIQGTYDNMKLIKALCKVK